MESPHSRTQSNSQNGHLKELNSTCNIRHASCIRTTNAFHLIYEYYVENVIRRGKKWMETRYFNQISTAVNTYVLTPTHSSVHANIKSREGSIQLLPLPQISFFEKTNMSLHNACVLCVVRINFSCFVCGERIKPRSMEEELASHARWSFAAHSRFWPRVSHSNTNTHNVEVETKNVWSRFRGKANKNREYHSIFKLVHQPGEKKRNYKRHTHTLTTKSGWKSCRQILYKTPLSEEAVISHLTMADAITLLNRHTNYFVW